MSIDVIDLAQRLVQIPSESGDALGIENVQHTIVDEVGADTSGDFVLTVGDSSRYPWKLLVSPRAAGGDRGPLFAAHADTVPIGDPSLWSEHPLSGRIDDRLHGRGSADMKAGAAAAAAAFAHACRNGKAASLLLTADEETGSQGAAEAMASCGAYIADQLRPSGVIIPEATDMKVRMCHRGALWIRLTSTGRAAHGSTPGRGENAILKLAGVLPAALDCLPLRDHARLGHETANLGTIVGGAAPNIVPAHAEAVVDHRTTGPSAHLIDFWRDQTKINGVEVLLDLPPLLTDVDDPWVRSLPADLDDAPTSFFTDGSVIAPRLPGVPVVVWGPGEPHQMHAADESITVAQVMTAATAFVGAQ